MISNNIVESIIPPPRLNIDWYNTLQKYPNKEYQNLKEAASKYYGLDANKIAVGSGVDSLILLSIIAFGEKTALCCPIFEVYKNCLKALNKKYLSLNFGAEYKVCAETVFERYDRDTTLIILASPNNPTGNTVKRTELIKILQNTSSILIIDEAYAELSGKSNIDLIKNYENVLIFRSLSKSFSLAGIRVGFAFGSEKIISKIEDLRMNIQPFLISGFSEKIAIEALKQKELPRRNKYETDKRKTWFIKKFQCIEDIRVYPSEANFILVEALTKDMRKKIESANIDNCCKYGLSQNFFRISITNKEFLNKLIEVIN